MNRIGNELGTIVGAKVFWRAVLFDGLLQPCQHILGSQRPIRP